MAISIGTKAIHEGSIGIVLWIYSNGQCEFRNLSKLTVTVVNLDELIIARGQGEMDFVL